MSHTSDSKSVNKSLNKGVSGPVTQSRSELVLNQDVIEPSSKDGGLAAHRRFGHKKKKELEERATNFKVALVPVL